MDEIYKLIGQVIAFSGGSTAIAYLLFQYLGKKWIENKFSENLEQLRHYHAMELQKLRVEIDALLSGAIKLQEKEFDVLPEAWARLDEAHTQIRWLVSPLQTYADVNKMNDTQLEEFLDSTEFSESQKNEIKTAHNKAVVYQDMIIWHKLHKVKKVFGELQAYIARNGIFIEQELKEKLTKISDILWSAIVSKEEGHENKDWRIQNKGWIKIKEETEPLYQEIESYIHRRLQSHAQKL